MKRRKNLTPARLVTLILSVCLLAQCGFFTALAAPAKESELYEPWKHGYRLVDVLNWDPATDPYAEELKAWIPLQERNEPFAATQANPNLKSEAKMYTVANGNYLSTDTTNAPYHGNYAYDSFSNQVYKFWQYTDMIGAGGRPTQDADRTVMPPERYGVIGIPIAPYTNAAHKNGVLAIAEYFIPRNPQYCDEWMYKDEDGNFPYAQKMLDIKDYYGFDGYFINNEGAFLVSNRDIFKEMLAWMVEQGCYIQVYDGLNNNGSGTNYQNAFNSVNSSWVKDDTYGKVSHSFWINYVWNTNNRLATSLATAASLELDPHETLFLGVECEMGQFAGTASGSAQSTRNLDMVLDETGNPTMSLALWGGNFVMERFNQTDNNRYKVGYQWGYEERERMWFTSPRQDPTDFATTGYLTNVDLPATIYWKGVSRYISERSVINGTVFTTNFNNGHGMQYFKNGVVSRDMEWTNISIQDIIPTWQWWVQGAGKDNLRLDWDYGPEYEAARVGAGDTYNYEHVGAYNGGSSLVVWGGLNGANFVNLYKTDLEVTEDSTISFTYNKPSADDTSAMRIGLIFKDNPAQKVYIPVADAGKQTDGWVTFEASLADYTDRGNLAAIGIELAAEAEIADYQVNFGQLKIGDGQDYAPDAPEGFKLDRVFDGTGEIRISWDIADYDEVKQYNVYAGYADGSERFIGGVYADNYYIQTLEDRDNIVSLKLKAVGADGAESAAAVVPFDQSGAVKNIRAESAGNRLTVIWDDPAVAFDSVKVELDYFYSTKVGTVAVASRGAGQAVLDIPLEDGSRYVLTLTTYNGGEAVGSVNYFGTLADNFSEPYDGWLRLVNPPTSYNINITWPSSGDAYRMHCTTTTTDGASSNTTHNLFGAWNSIVTTRNISVAANVATMTIVLEDKKGNMSEPVVFKFFSRVPVNVTALQKAIADFEALDPNDYSIATWNTAQAAYDAAVAVLEKQDATQAEADKAAAALEAAIDGLVRRATDLKITGPVSVTVKKGKTAPLGFTYNGGDENIRFISSNPSVVTVTNDGVVKGVKTGMAIITAYTVDGSNLYSYTVVNVIA